ncbi:MAG: exodeoxyribonuclease VII small subunit [Planctomycetota bacterium]|nr:MAG: exodeoxyribonuclease VII small subunit [Planctomycetota bacterium]
MERDAKSSEWREEDFEKNFQELESIVQSLEKGELTLNDFVRSYQKGIQSLKKCYEILHRAEKKIFTLKKELDELEIQEFRGGG